jgi:hypothetical protein
MAKIELTLYSAPRTKKSHPTIVMRRAVRLPSKPYTEWLAYQLQFTHRIRELYKPVIPFIEPVSVQARVYRDGLTGDLLGYLDAVSDALQSCTYQCQNPQQFQKTVKKKSTGVVETSTAWRCHKIMNTDVAPERCEFCKWPAPRLKRRGLGVIKDDRLIQSWDGSRLDLDRNNPRVELVIQKLDLPQYSLALESTKEEDHD